MLRGFALIGVILANFQSMISWDDPAGAGNTAAIWFLENLVSGRFYRLFAFLFGLGFALQMIRLESRGVRFVPLYIRRLLILGVIGIAHGILFWPNDILALFAQFGLLLLLVRHLSDRAIVPGCGSVTAGPTRLLLRLDRLFGLPATRANTGANSR